MSKSCEECAEVEQYCEHCATCHKCLNKYLSKPNLSLAKFEITNVATEEKHNVTAQGALEAILELLSHQSLELSVKSFPLRGLTTVIDNRSGLEYSIQLL